MKISFAAGFAPVVESLDASTALYAGALGLPFDDPTSDHPMTNHLDGLKYFGLWTLKDCAQSCFRRDEWPEDRIKPQGCIEFDVESPEAVPRPKQTSAPTTGQIHADALLRSGNSSSLMARNFQRDPSLFNFLSEPSPSGAI